MLKPITYFAAVLIISACTPQQASWNTGQFFKDKDCDQNSSISYKRCDTNIQEEYENAQEIQRELEAGEQEQVKEQKVKEALQRSEQ